MQLVTSITSDPKQFHQLVLENNDTVDFRLYFSTRQEAWFFDFEYKDIKANCLKVVISPNTLRTFKRLIPFGIAFTSVGNVEPFRIDDFSEGRVEMYILNSDEVQMIEEEVYNR